MPDLNDTSFLAGADAAAEAAAAAVRNGGEPATVSHFSDDAGSNALDDAFASLGQDAAKAPADDADFGKENGGVKMPIEGAPPEPEPKTEAELAAEQAAIDKAEADRKAAAAKPADTTPPKKKSLLDSIADPSPKTDTADTKKDPYEDLKLRSDASDKTKETFTNLKQVAREREQAAVTAREQAEAKAAELQAKIDELSKNTVPPETQAELKELREFRAQFDTERSPEFKQQYDTKIDANYETIYQKLKSHGLPDTEIAKLKAFSRADRDNAIDSFLDKIPVTSKRVIEAKLIENTSVAEQREQALAAARGKADQILAERAKAPADALAKRDAAIVEVLNPVLTKLPWLHLQEIPPTATAEQKAEITAANEFATEMQASLKRAILDDSPDARAEAALAVPLAHYYVRENAALTAQVKDLTTQLEQIKAAGATGRRLSNTIGNAPASRTPASESTKNQSSGDALDSLFASVTSGKS